MHSNNLPCSSNVNTETNLFFTIVGVIKLYNLLKLAKGEVVWSGIWYGDKLVLHCCPLGFNCTTSNGQVNGLMVGDLQWLIDNRMTRKLISEYDNNQQRHWVFISDYDLYDRRRAANIFSLELDWDRGFHILFEIWIWNDDGMMRVKWTGDVITPLDGGGRFFDYLIQT